MKLSIRRNDPFVSQLVHLVFPIMLQNFMLAMVSATDALMLGMIDQQSLAAVSLAGQIQFVLNLFVTAMAIGTGIIAAQYWGKGDPDTIESVVPVALRANLVCGFLFSAAALICPDFLMRLFTNEEPLIQLGARYLRMVSLSYFLCGISQIYLTVLKNTGCTAISSRISSAAVVINIILNGLLIFGVGPLPRMEIQGAALATVIARMVELIWAYVETRKPSRVAVRWDRLMSRNPSLSHDFWHYTYPVLGASLVWGIAFVLHSVIIGHLGSDAVAANSIAGIAKSLICCLARGIGGGAGIIIGNTLGAGDMERARDYGKRLTILSAVAGVLTGLLLMLLSPVIVSLAHLNSVSSGYLQGMLLIASVNLMGQAVNITVLDGIFCAGGDSRFDMIGNIGAMWCFAIPLGFLAAFVWKLPILVVFLLINLDELVKLPAVFHHYKKYIWLRNITH